MKKKLLTIIVLMLMIVGCGYEKFYLEDEYYESAKITEITIDEFKELEEEKKNFMVFVYLPGCTSCAQFKSVLEEYLKDHTLEIYSISILETEGTSIRENVQYAPSMVLYKEGEVVVALDSTSDDDKPALTTTDGFNKWLDEYIYLTK